jgi:hypothetical protein
MGPPITVVRRGSTLYKFGYQKWASSQYSPGIDAHRHIEAHLDKPIQMPINLDLFQYVAVYSR